MLFESELANELAQRVLRGPVPMPGDLPQVAAVVVDQGRQVGPAGVVDVAWPRMGGQALRVGLVGQGDAQAHRAVERLSDEHGIR